ncbi:Vha36-2 [Drosophila busckii]|uniref:Vha36-2 n=1 Tax=Drosophila busckii TaxID=30019 RepID=A0A0M5J392_DROBS|nr:V-type proton ATPase subunit D 1 [Drosophila busckii]ALC42774.1 Vha36-2 [Drosophila busckii]
MTSSSDRLPIFPSRANLVIMQQRVLAAKRGMGLLKRKRDAIDLKLRDLNRLMDEREETVDNKIRLAIFSLAKANLLGTDFKPMIVSESKPGSAYMRRRHQKIVGVSINSFELEVHHPGGFPLAGLSCGGAQVQKVRGSFEEALREIVEVASMEYMLRMLVIASRQTNMRVNALDHVVIPRLVKTQKYISGELEELEREDFYRLKRSQAKQLEAKIAFSELIKTRNMTEEELNDYLRRGAFLHPVADVLFDEEEFNAESVEGRRRQVRIHSPVEIAEERKEFSLSRPSRRLSIKHSLTHRDSRHDSYLPAASSSGMQLFLQRGAQRDPRSSRANLLAPPHWRHRNTSSSSEEEDTDPATTKPN